MLRNHRSLQVFKAYDLTLVAERLFANSALSGGLVKVRGLGMVVGTHGARETEVLNWLREVELVPALVRENAGP